VSIGRGSTGFGAIGDGLGDDADVIDAGLAQGINDRGERSKGHGFVAAQENGVLRLF